MTRTAVFTAKVVGVWIAALVSSIFAAQLIEMGDEGIGTDGPLTGPQAFVIVNLVHAAVLGLIAERSTLRGKRLASLIWATLFFAQSFLLLMEAAYFRDSLQMSQGLLLKSGLHVLLSGAIISAVVGMLWQEPVRQVQYGPPLTILPIRLAVIAAFYIICYFVAGYYIAWQVNDVQQYYGFGEDIALVPLLLFQMLRGAMWGLLAYILVRSLVGRVGTRAFVVGISFSVLATTQLLYPSSIMPWEVRFAHMVEVGISNFIFGFAASLILLARHGEAGVSSANSVSH